MASATLIVIFSVILYNYIKISIYEDLTVELTKEAVLIAAEHSSAMGPLSVDIFRHSYNAKDTEINIVLRVDKKHEISFEQKKRMAKTILPSFIHLKKTNQVF